MSANDARDLDAPRPPGGPQRTDAPAGPDTPGEEGQDPGPQVQRVTRPEDDGDVGEPDLGTREQGTRDRRLQEQNAETSLDEPSDGSGGE
ncbi:MAG: Carbamoyl-phosphate synthase chain ATP-binding [Nocardioides sp.]|nr:Carbamoyl-phosphate synthase chain ATP-binding [Nocardioides sp.]